MTFSRGWIIKIFMNCPTLTYNKSLDRSLQQSLKLAPGPVSLSDEDFIYLILKEYRNPPGCPSEGLSRAEFLFYILMQVGRKRPGLFLTPDLNLAMFNLLAARHCLNACRLVCLDLGLLPVALLASGMEARVALPPIDNFKSWPDWLFPVLRSQDRSWLGAIILGRDTLKLTSDNPELPQKLVEAAGGLFFSYWDFLGVNLHDQVRKKWLTANILRSIIQLPRPRFQTVVYYPAFIETGRVEPGQVRVAAVKENRRGSGGLSQTEVLRVVLEAPDGKNSQDVPPESLTDQHRTDFTPRRFLVNQPNTEMAPLKEYAKLIRCQLQRTKLTPDELADPELSRDGICREITFPNLDEKTGFLKPGSGNWIRLQRVVSPLSLSNFLLRAHDILISFRGTEATIGRVGLVNAQPQAPCITGQSLCIVRPDKKMVDPTWLYHYLRREETRQKVLSHSTGSSMLTVNTGDLAQLPIPCPGAEEVEACREQHEDVQQLMDEIHRLYALVENKMQNLDSRPNDRQNERKINHPNGIAEPET